MDSCMISVSLSTTCQKLHSSVSLTCDISKLNGTQPPGPLYVLHPCMFMGMIGMDVSVQGEPCSQHLAVAHPSTNWAPRY